MNNYCTNCGKKLKSNELVCENCNIPIIDLPCNYVYISPKKKKIIRNILIVLGLIILGIVIFCFARQLSYKIKINALQKKYVNPYLIENYGNLNYSIKYDTSGKCIISGNCYFDPVMGCDGGVCQVYKYLDENECRAYYYSVESDTQKFIVTVVNKDNQFYAVEGRNIYGNNKKNN